MWCPRGLASVGDNDLLLGLLLSFGGRVAVSYQGPIKFQDTAHFGNKNKSVYEDSIRDHFFGSTELGHTRIILQNAEYKDEDETCERHLKSSP